MGLFLIGFSILFSSVFAWSGKSEDRPSWADRVDEVVERYEIDKGPGGVVAVIEGDSIVYSKSFGYADISTKRKNTPETFFDIASCAKQFTAASVMILAEQSKIDLDKPIQNYFPEFAIKVPIPVRSLLTHSSGLHDYSEMLLLARGRDQIHTYTKSEILEIIFSQTTLSFKPLTDENYSNTNYVILAELVERVSNQAFEEFVADHLFNPIGISDSEMHFIGAGKIDSLDYAIAYPSRSPGSLIFTPALAIEDAEDNTSDFLYGSSGIMANIYGLARWMGNFKEATIGNEGLMDLLLHKDSLTNGSLTTYSRGFVTGTVPPGYTYVEHTGRNNFTSVMLWWPDVDYSMVAMMNTQEIWAQSLTNEFYMDILADLPSEFEQEVVGEALQDRPQAAEFKPKPAIELSLLEMQKFVGIYPADAPVGGRKPPSGGVGVNKIILHDGKLKGIRYDKLEFELYPISKNALGVKGAPIEFHFVDLNTDVPGFSFFNPYDNGENMVAYKIPGLRPEDIKMFCGQYSCPTLLKSVPIEIAYEDNKLYMSWGVNKNRTELHYLGDRLTSYLSGPNIGMQCNLVIQRNTKGEISGFNYDGHRVWNLSFEKE